MSENKIDKKMNQFVVIGLGRFGRSVATTLSSLGKEVLVIDTNAEAIKQIENHVTSAVVADATATDVLYSLGVQNFDCVINCIGEDLQANILTTLICKDLGVKFIVAKAQNEQNKKVLERVGADLVVFPEVVVGKKIASMLSNPTQNEIMNLNDNYKIVEIIVPDSWTQKTILENNVRKKYNVLIIFIKRQDLLINPEAETILEKGDILILAGKKDKIDTISKKSKEILDVNESLQEALDFE